MERGEEGTSHSRLLTPVPDVNKRKNKDGGGKEHLGQCHRGDCMGRGCNKRKAELLETDQNKMEERLKSMRSYITKRWECFQRTSKKKPAGIGMRPMPSSRIGPKRLESKFGGIQKKPHPRSMAPAGAIFRGYLALTSPGGRKTGRNSGGTSAS